MKCSGPDSVAVAAVLALMVTPFPASVRAEDAAAAEPQSAGLAEVVVTAQKRSENLQDVPISVISIGHEQLEKSNVKNMQDLANTVAGFQGPGDVGVGSPHIRGVGTVITTSGNELAVATYVDGVFLPTNIYPPVYDFKDAASVEVLKGPQGTLFGRNATGGLINITTRNPGKSFEAEAEVGYANYQTESGFFYAGGPVSDRVSTGLAVSASHQGQGWGTNLYDGREIGRTNLNLSARNKWLLQLGDDTQAMVSVNFAKTNSICVFCFHPYPYNGHLVSGQTPVPSPYDLDGKLVPASTRGMADVTAQLTHDFGFAKLTSIAGYYNLSGSDIPLNSDPTVLDRLHIASTKHAIQTSEELQLASEISGPFQWQAGLYYLKGYTDINGTATIASTRNSFLGSGEIIKSLAGYAQGTYALTDADKLTIGARLTHETHDLVPNPRLIDATGGVHEQVSTTPTWRGAFDHQFTGDLSSYVSVTRGFKSGAFNNTPVGAQQGPFLPESIVAYELGAKSMWLDRKVRFNPALFYSDYSNLQTQSLAAAGTEVISNAAKAKLYGLDVEFEALLTQNLTITSTLEYLHSKYTDFANADIFTQIPTGGVHETRGPATGNELVLAPKFTGSLSGDYRFPTRYGNFEADVTYSYNAGYFVTVDNHLRQPAYNLVGASLKYSTPDDRYWVKFWGRNLSNALTTALLSFGAFGPEAFYNSPRTYGVDLGVKF